jgi:uncharacterized protein (DUF2141 family)
MPEVTLRVHRVRNARGQIIAGLYAENDFKRFGGGPPVARVTGAAQKDEVELVFADVPPGRWAASAYHDENGNGRLDLVFTGVPAEGRGYSNVPRPALAPPPFADASFEVADDPVAVEAWLAYLK